MDTQPNLMRSLEDSSALNRSGEYLRGNLFQSGSHKQKKARDESQVLSPNLENSVLTPKASNLAPSNNTAFLMKREKRSPWYKNPYKMI